MAYTPNPLDPTLPVGNILVATLTSELRALKTRLVTDKNDIESINADIEAIETTLTELGNQVNVAQSSRFALLTNAFPSQFEVPQGITEITVFAVGGGQGGMGGWGYYIIDGGRILQDGKNSYAGQSGDAVIQTITVTPGEMIDYTCGAGGAGGARATGNYGLGGSGFAYRQHMRSVKRLMCHGPNSSESGETNKICQLTISRAHANGIMLASHADHTLLMQQTSGQSGYPDEGADGVATTLSWNGGANTINAAGGSAPFAEKAFQVNPIPTILGGYGMGGFGGTNRYRDGATTVDSTAGLAGQPGAILLMW